MSSTIANPELLAFQKAVLAKINEVASTTYWHGFDQIKRDLGLDDIVEDHVVTVRVTVPAADPAAAAAAVAEQVSTVYLPTGWSAEVAS